MKYEIHWCAWDGDKEQVIDADSEADALNIAEQRWHENRKTEPVQINAFPVFEHDTKE